MKITEYTIIENRPSLIAKHYFNIFAGDLDERAIYQYKLKQDQNGQYFLPQYDKSGRPFDVTFSTLQRTYGRPRTVKINR